MKRIFTHWKTSLAGLLAGTFTVLLVINQITVTQWIEGMGAVTLVIGLLAKDWDKVDQ